MNVNTKTMRKAVMVAIVLVWMASLAFGSDITQTTVRNGYIVNPDNVTISIDENTTAILIGQNVQFMCEGSKTGTVTATGVEGTSAEGYVVTSDSTGWLDTSVMTEEGLYNATYGEHWELLAVSNPVMDLKLKVGTKEGSSICRGTPLGMGFISNLDENDCVDLRIITPEGLLKQNPADSSQKFDDINVTQLLEYGSENESKRINTSGWKIGTYTFSVRTEKENARGLDVSSNTRTLAILKAEVDIVAEKTRVVELEKVRLIIRGVCNHNITISSSDPAHTIFPAGYEDNPSYTTSEFNNTIDEDGERRYVVYFNDTGSYTITVRDITAGLYDTIDITVSEKAVIFNVPSTVVIGMKFTIKGTANTGNTLDIAVEDYVYPQLNDLLIDENGEFAEEIDTATANITPFTVPGSVRLKAYIDRTAGAGAIGANETEDGSVAILMIGGYLTAELSTYNVAQGDDFTVSGTAIAIGSWEVNIIAIAPNGSNGTLIDGSSGEFFYNAMASVAQIDYTFAKKIPVGENVDTGSYLVVVLGKGRDGKYGHGYDNLTAALSNYNLTNKTQVQLLAILEDATIDAAGSDDLMWLGSIEVETPFVKLNPIADVAVGEPLVITGKSNRNEGHPIVVTVKGPTELTPQMIKVKNSVFSATFDTSKAHVGVYTVKADDGDGHTDETTVNIVAPVPFMVNLSTDVVSLGSSFEVYGCSPSDYVEIVAVSPKGGNGTGMDGLYGVSIWTVPTFKPGSYKMDVWITINDSMRNKEDEGIPIIIIAPGITVNLSTNLTHPGRSFVINGTAYGSTHVDLITISPRGGDGTGLYEKSYPGVPGITNESIPVDENYTFSKRINVSENADTGKYVIWVSAPGRDGVYGAWNEVNNASELIKQIIDDYCSGDVTKLYSKTQNEILAILRGATINRAGSDDLACIKELHVVHPSYNFYKKIKVDIGADIGNYTIIVLSPGMDGVYGNSTYKYIDSILDLDGGGPELGAIDVSNKTKEEIVAIIKDVTIDQAGSDDLIWKGDLIVYQPKTIYVDDDFEDDPANHRWNTIQEGINDAGDGWTVIVKEGTYIENVKVNKTLNIRSENGTNSTIVQAANPDYHVFEVSAPYVNISGFTVKGALHTAGIFIEKNADHCSISDNTVLENGYGFWICSSQNEISYNIAKSNTKYGICLYNSYNNITDNIASNNDNGISIQSSSYNYLTRNAVLNNRYYGVDLFYSSNNNLTSNIATNNGAGLCMMFSNNNSISYNTASNNEGGIKLTYSNNNTFINNIVNNTNCGIEIYENCSYNILIKSILSNNSVGISLGSFDTPSNNNKIYLNNFINNNQNVYSSNSTNIWNSTEKITYTYKGKTYTNYIGNYWSDYNGSDADRDGIGDTPCDINSDKDNYPLIEPWENYFAPYFAPIENIFDTGSPANPYPSISGTHKGIITPNIDITVTKLYTYPCIGTGGHTEYAAIFYPNGTLIAEAYWNGYIGDWHNITFNKTFTLVANETYLYEIRTGSYPQIHHTPALLTANGWINCTNFKDANGRVYYDWIPAIRLD